MSASFEPPPMLSLPAAFGLEAAPGLVAFVGGGGKTSLMFALAQALPGPVVMTTTTRIFASQMALAPAVCSVTDLEPLAARLAQHGACLVVAAIAGDKAQGVPLDLPGRLLARPDVAFVLVEADGSRLRPVKAPAEHEPAVPPETTLLVPVAGIDALGGRIQDVAHRPQRVSALTGLAASDALTAGAMATLLTHPQAGLKNAPTGARIIAFLNKVETPAQLTAAYTIARLCLRQPRLDRVVIGAAQTAQPVRAVCRRVTAVVLAAGEARRMGRAKQLLPWGDTTVLGQTLRQVKQAAVDHIVVVSGHRAAETEAIATAHNVAALYNPDYAAGEMLSSLQAAVRRLPPEQAAVLVMLADQPMIEPSIIDSLIEAYWQGGELIAPVYRGQRGNPVLIGRPFFAELLQLPPGSAPRKLLRRHQDVLRLVPVTSDTILRDLDQPEDYQRWRPQ